MKKIFALILAIGIMTFGFNATSFAATIGFVNMEKIVSNYPGMNDLAKEIINKQVSLQKEFDDKSKKLDNQKKLELQAKLNKELAEFENKKMEPVQKDIREIILKVAEAKGIDSVVSNKIMVTGGEDLTDEVINSLKK